MASADSAGFPTLASVTNSIAASIPSLAGFAYSIGHNVPTGPVPSAPPAPSVESLASNIGAQVPSLAGAASEVAHPVNVGANAPKINVNTSVTTSNADLDKLENVINSFAKIPSLAGMVSSLTRPPVTYPTAPPSSQTAGNNHTGKSVLFKNEDTQS